MASNLVGFFFFTVNLDDNIWVNTCGIIDEEDDYNDNDGVLGTLPVLHQKSVQRKLGSLSSR